jgi:hypothetical protein
MRVLVPSSGRNVGESHDLVDDVETHHRVDESVLTRRDRSEAGVEDHQIAGDKFQQASPAAPPIITVCQKVEVRIEVHMSADERPGEPEIAVKIDIVLPAECLKAWHDLPEGPPHILVELRALSFWYRDVHEAPRQWVHGGIPMAVGMVDSDPYEQALHERPPPRDRGIHGRRRA